LLVTILYNFYIPMSLSIGINKTPWRLILTTEAFSSLTNQFLQILLPWYVLSSTDSILWAGVVGCCSLLPNIISALFAGPVIDKIGRSKTMFLCEIFQFLLLASIPILINNGAARAYLIGLIVLLVSFFDAPGKMARTALVPSFSRYAGVPVPRTTGLLQALDGCMTVIGPILGGAIILSCGLLVAWDVSVLFCAVIVSLCLTVFSNRRARVKRPQVTYRQVETFIKEDSFLRVAVLFTLPTFILGESWELLILPAYVYGHGLTAVHLGILGGAFGLGAFLGALWFAKSIKKVHFFELLTVNYAGYWISVLVLYFKMSFPTVVVATVLCGLPFGAFGAMITSTILVRTPVELRSKMLALYTAAVYVCESVSVLGVAYCIYCCGLQTTLKAVSWLFGLLVVSGLFMVGRGRFTVHSVSE
ncbi:MAG: MFS transporter, partial [Elusimicrobiaceae bacterium]|nr:MFS transporter [Elusimicrobiaceae bacterium]